MIPELFPDRTNVSFPSFDVLYQDQWILAINKLGFIPVAPSIPVAVSNLKRSTVYEQKGAQDSLLGQLQRWLITQKGKEKESKEKGEKGDILQGARAGVLEANYNQSSPNLPYLGLVHRIDQPVTGVVLFARDPATLELLNRQFRDRQVFKLYWAVTESRPPKDTGTLEHSITFDPKKNKSRIFPPSDPGDIRIPGRQPRAKKALLHYRVVGNSERYFFLEIELITGRPHQIRAQLAAIGCPIKGDLKYGARRSNPGGGILLHARSIRFTHPKTGLPLTLTAEPPPSILWELFPRSSRS